MTRVLVTGATGFVGTTACELLAGAGYAVRAGLHTDRPLPAAVAEKVLVGDIARPVNLPAALDGVDAVIHAAARTHVLHDSPANAGLYASVNTEGTLRLAEAAAQAGVHRFLYLSSIKVNGERTSERAYGPDDEPAPADAYALSKWRGEQCLREVAARTGMEAVIVRPPLVYGPGVGANFLRLMRWVDSGWPLPLGGINNRRSLVNVWNLCGLLLELLRNPAASGGTWMVSDGQDLSTPELLRYIGSAMRRRVRLVSVPEPVLRACGRLIGRQSEIARLCDSLSIDTSQTQRRLGWSPTVGVGEALARTARWYRGVCRR